MKTIRYFVLVLVVLGLVLAGTAQAQEQGLQVWLVQTHEETGPLVEYRSAGGQVFASYVVGQMMFDWSGQAAGRLAGNTPESVALFDPVAGRLSYFRPAGVLPNTDTDFYYVTRVVLSPDGQQVAYGVTRQSSNYELPAESWIYIGTPGAANDRSVYHLETESFRALAPVAWSADGAHLLIDIQPQGIGGYILFWLYFDVQVLDIASGAATPVGSIDGYTPDLGRVARLDWAEDGSPTALVVTDLATGAATGYPVPLLDEVPASGGDAIFSPSGTQVVYQLARMNPEQEKFWTVVVNLSSGASTVVFTEEWSGWGNGFGNLGGWLDESTLAVGSVWGERTAIVDVPTAAMLREENGVFLGYANGITSAAQLAPSGAAAATCSDAPLSRLTPGKRGRVTFTTGSLTNVRNLPGLDGEITGSMPEGSTFSVYQGPICADGYAWWQLGFDDGPVGYVAEGTADSYWLEPWE
ncbi:MAG: SH3 domain-containing protein [Anaerolineae bacterium]|nr:SH3 domain-containing protein [Anaerolineae bacterium]